jgi:D-3-phosphoglycerate dehydrogenase
VPLLPRVVVADPIDAEAIRNLSAGPCEVVDATEGPEALARSVSEAWALVVRSRTQVTASLLGNAPHLRVVARAGVGVDNVDLAAATERGIRVVNAPTAATLSVAELTVAFALLLVRSLYSPIQSTRAGGWHRGLHGGEIAGKTVGLIGYGRIGREVARRFRAFEARVIAHDPLITRSSDDTPLVSLEELLARADLVSLHAALTPENHHLLNAERIGRMHPGAFVINVARGALIDETALAAALREGRLGGAALDVFETEPPRGSPLLELPTVLPTPHLGASTPEAQARAGQQIVEEIHRLLRGERPLYLVNTEVEDDR